MEDKEESMKKDDGGEDILSSIESSSKQTRIFKIIVIGDSNVGKTCLTFRFCGGKFPEKTEATIGVDFREKTVDVNGETIKLQLWDTAGQERFRKSMVQHYYRNVHAVVFVYDMTKMNTFEGMPTWIEECERHSLSPDIPRILVGNKCDMNQKISVATSLAQKFADANQMPLFETSAKDDNEVDNVSAIFMTLAHKLKSQKPMMSNDYPVLHKYGSKEMKRAKVISIGREPSSRSAVCSRSTATSDGTSCSC
ncbi:putative Ras-related protein Rab-33 [Saccoglossus kowalevskii]|uniref:Ras-related protein Rab-33-like n=1 Tax=Saccoglossus kowalevskii TaxID=10224 RepID=A0ABM0GZC3_SACKO|nr:PREDICTED: putative Ras-related protein Rab-33-like [Saccoglossus kowalevskii]